MKDLILKDLILKALFLVFLVTLLGCGTDATSGVVPAADTSVAVDVVADVASPTNPDVATSEPDTGPAPLAPLPALVDPVSVSIEGVEGTAIQPAIALGKTGTMAVAYTSRKAPGSAELGVYSVVGDREPVPLSEGGEGHNEPTICTLAGGGFVVVWSVSGVDALGGLGVAMRRLNIDGTPATGQVLLDTGVEGNHWLGSVACLSDGGFVVAGSRAESDDSFGAFAWTFDNGSLPTAAALSVNTDPAGGQTQASVGAGADGGFIVVWDDTQDDLQRVLARSFDGAGQGGDIWTVGGSQGVIAGAAASAGDWQSGSLAAAASEDGHLVVSLVTETGLEPVTLPGGTIQRVQPALAFADRPDVLALLWLDGTSTATEARLAWVGPGAPDNEPVVLGPVGAAPYFPSITYRDGRLAAAWTRRTPDGFVIETAKF